MKTKLKAALAKFKKLYPNITSADLQTFILGYQSAKESFSNPESNMKLKIYKVEFKGIWPVGNCLILAAQNKWEAKKMTRETIKHTDIFTINEIILRKPQIIEYLSGDY